MTGASAQLRHIAIRDFRNFAGVEVGLVPEGLVLVGDNGQGKTNFLEAVYYLQILRSARGTRDADVVRFGTAGFHIAASLAGSARAGEIGVGYERAGKQKRVRLDGVVIDRLGEALGALPSVLFAPTDVSLVAGEPAIRRRYLDIMLALTSRPYLTALQNYRAALARRNAVLHRVARIAKGKSADAQIAIWEPPLAEHGARLAIARREWVARVAARFDVLCRSIGERGNACLRYATSIGTDGDPVVAIAKALEEQRALDVTRGTTHAGPHRDNLVLTLDGHDLRAFGSAGQQRTASIALRILEVETYRDRTGAAPVFLMDDPFAELDARRASRIVGVLAESGLGQTLLAVPNGQEVPAGFAGLPRVWVESGAIRVEAGAR